MTHTLTHIARIKNNGPILHWPQVWGGNRCLMIGNWIAH
jgi:hypothetical protein